MNVGSRPIADISRAVHPSDMNYGPKLRWPLWQECLVIGLAAAALALAFPSWNELFWSIAAGALGWAAFNWMDKQ